MTRVRFALGAAVVSACCLGLLTARAGAQAPDAAPAGAVVVGAGNFIHVVGDVDRSQAFYERVIGLAAAPGRGRAGAPRPAANGQPAPRRWITDRPDIARLYNADGRQYRNGGAGIAGLPMRVETMEFSGERSPVHPRVQDPGAAMFVATVRDLDAVMARVRKAQVPIVTAGSAPVTIEEDGESRRAVLLKDPDGFYVALVQRPSAPAGAAPTENVVATGFAFTVSDTDRMLRVFSGALGFDMTSEPFSSDRAHLALFGTPGAQYRLTTGIVPGSSTRVELLEFKGIDRKPTPQTTTRDPGTAVLRVRVGDANEAIAKLAGVGVRVTSTGGMPVDVVGGRNQQRFAITSAPDNLFIQVVQQMPRPTGATR
jgi:catechol 2,3-dioxygenase-like lactoylglutathione lyase family enzyme